MTGHMLLFASPCNMIDVALPVWSVFEKRMVIFIKSFLKTISSNCSALLLAKYLFWQTNSPILKRPKNAYVKTVVNIFASYSDMQIVGSTPMSLRSKSGVMGCLVSGDTPDREAPFIAFFTKKSEQGSGRPCTLCQLLTAHTYVFMVEGAIFFSDRNATKCFTSVGDAGEFTLGECMASLNLLKLDIPTSNICSVRGAHAIWINLLELP